MVLIQNSSADRLGLNPAGLTKWEKHFVEGVVSRSLMQVSFSKEMYQIERCSCGLDCSIRTGEDSCRIFRELGT